MNLASLLKKGSLRGLATATPATLATVQPFTAPSVATVATVNVASPQNPAANDGALNTLGVYELPTPAAPDPDRWCWPHSSAMNGAEIDTYALRLHRFSGKGLPSSDGEALADRLVRRDREVDDRQVCLECSHLAGQGAGTWRCRNWQAAGVATRSREAQLPADLVVQLQRCNGFTAHLTSIQKGTDHEQQQD
jgi:hypothetical protein